MRSSGIIFGFFILIVVGCGSKDCGKKTASLSIYNDAVSNVVSITVYSNDADQPIIIGGLPLHETKTKCIKCNGECSFSIEVVFENGDMLKSIDHYSEGGSNYAVEIEPGAIELRSVSGSY